MVDLVAALMSRFVAVVAPAPLREGELAAGDPFPAVALEVDSQVKTPTVDGDDGLVDAQVTFACVAYRGSEAKALAALLRDAVQDETFPAVWGGVAVRTAWWDEQYRGLTTLADDASGRKIHEIQLNLNITYED